MNPLSPISRHVYTEDNEDSVKKDYDALVLRSAANPTQGIIDFYTIIKHPSSPKSYVIDAKFQILKIINNFYVKSKDEVYLNEITRNIQELLDEEDAPAETVAYCKLLQAYLLFEYCIKNNINKFRVIIKLYQEIIDNPNTPPESAAFAKIALGELYIHVENDTKKAMSLFRRIVYESPDLNEQFKLCTIFKIANLLSNNKETERQSLEFYKSIHNSKTRTGLLAKYRMTNILYENPEYQENSKDILILYKQIVSSKDLLNSSDVDIVDYSQYKVAKILFSRIRSSEHLEFIKLALFYLKNVINSTRSLEFKGMALELEGQIIDKQLALMKNKFSDLSLNIENTLITKREICMDRAKLLQIQVQSSN